MGKTPMKNQYEKFLHSIHRALFLQTFPGVITAYGAFVVLHVESCHVMTNSDSVNVVAC